MIFPENNDLPYMDGSQTKFGVPTNVEFQIRRQNGRFYLIHPEFNEFHMYAGWVSKDILKQLEKASSPRGEQLSLCLFPYEGVS